MERHFHEELSTLKCTLVAMADLAAMMLDDSIRMLAEHDMEAMDAIQANEDRVNHLQCEIDDTCTRLIALFQPTASDLRFILGCIKTNSDLERLADEALNVSRKAKRFIRESPIPKLDILHEMALIASSMVKEGIQVFVSGDVEKARKLIKRDKKLNKLKTETTAQAFALMEADPGALKVGFDLILAARNIERIGDHVKNIAENAVFVAEGSDIRHHFDAPE